MEKKKSILPLMIIGSAIAITRMLSARSASKKSVSQIQNYESIDLYIEEQMHRLHIPGASLAIVEGEKIVHQRGFGRTRPAGELPTPQTPFFIGSLTKSITATAIMQLVEAGKVELDAPVQHYLPWFRVADPVASAQITVRHLLNQTSGFSLLSSEIAKDDYADRTNAVEYQVRALSSEKLKSPPGSKWGYSNHNYVILGLIIEVVSGQTYSEYIRRHIFDPLDMTQSFTTKVEARKNGLAVGYRHWFSLPFPVPKWKIPPGFIPSDQLISCAEDMAHYLIAHLNNGKYRKAQILSSAGTDELHRGVKDVVMFGVHGGSYGMGWFDIDLGSLKTYSHGGNVPDFSAFMAIIPEQNRGVILLFNADPYGLPVIMEEVGMGVTALLAGQHPAPIKLEFIQWITRLLPLIPLLQIIGVFTTISRLRGWRRDPGAVPVGDRLWCSKLFLSLIPNLSLSGLLVYLRSSGLMRYLRLFNPDVAWIAQLSGTFAGILSLLRTGLILMTLSKH